MEEDEDTVPVPYVFSRDVFDKFTLSPNIKELFELLQSSESKPNGPPEKNPEADSKPGTADPVCKDLPPQSKPSPGKTADALKFPAPLVPYPCFTKINVKERRHYLHILKGNKYNKTSKGLMLKVENEVAEFMKYMMEVFRARPDIYNHLPPPAERYSQEYFVAALERMKTFPQVYSILEITSLTSLKFTVGLSLRFEKQLLAMGKVVIVPHCVIPENSQLPVDYETVAKAFPAEKKAASEQSSISDDRNAEKLSAVYEPHVCLTKEAFVLLLNNSPELGESWELPVLVAAQPGMGSGQRRTAFVDAPLLKTEMSHRERSLLFHQESLKLCFKKKPTKPEKTQRSVVEFDDEVLNLETDLTDLESFGESSISSKKAQDKPNEAKAASHQLPPCPEKHRPSSSTKNLSSAAREDPAEVNTRLDEAGAADDSERKSLRDDTERPPISKRLRSSEETHPHQDSDSDEGRLVIAHMGSPAPRSAAQETASPTKPPGRGARKGIKRQRQPDNCDQLGQILRMQDAMLKPSPGSNPEVLKAPVLERKVPGTRTHSLVKQSVSSYLESSREGKGEEGMMPADVPVMLATQKKCLLREDLQGCVEDESDYDPPEEGAVLYKLYSLLDVLLMVRSSVNIALSKHDRSTSRVVPVHVLPKLEYQLCYGAESMTHTEACRVWAEKLLHSSTESYISRVNALTSEVAEVQKLSDDWMQKLTCDLNPTRCLNNLYNILKKVTGLQEGRYLLVHKPREGFITIYKAADESKVVRSAYNLQAVHNGPPIVPPGVPWVALDPTHILPFHQRHNRPPCTFPPPPPIPPRSAAENEPNPRKKNNNKKKKNKNKKISPKKQEWLNKHTGPGSSAAILLMLYVKRESVVSSSQRKPRMAMISEFLGQLTLQMGGGEPTFPTVVPEPNFDPDKDAARIETAIKTKGVDEQTIIDIITKRTYGQRREIAFAYERRAKKDMISALKSALSGSLETVILGLMKSTAQFDASEIKASIKGLGTDEESLIEMLCSRSNEEITEIKKVYKELFKKDLEKDVAGDTSGDFAKLLLALVEAKRDGPSSVVDNQKIDDDARALYDAGVKRKGTDVKCWISIMSERSVPHLQKVFQRYKSYSPYDMQESIRKEVKGDLELSFLTLVQCFENKQLYFASRLQDAMKSKGAKEKVLTRIMVSRCEVDLKKIREEFKKHFGKSLHQTIAEHTKGDYQRALLSLCGGDD
ncbi:hypothetical protein DNTS_015814 [Danionella cerebrum]|uniref:Annexin n=1 Tax=Danionella cerebrum TaxID=2873325 RepID=A0A553QXB9_9TELE|nr:hypothetical protein DNTS_015814 [Danionella translucida]